MLTKVDKRDRAALFRTRLQTAMAERHSTQSALARAAGVDRSTISQLMQDDGSRLPNAHLVASCAAALGVSADWLLGLSERPERAADLIAAAMSMPEAPRALVDEHIFGWHQEAAGYKIRHVPAGLPDMLKTEAMLRWEYTPSLGRTIDQAIGASQDRLNLMRGARSDFEIALPVHELAEFATGTGYYDGLPAQVRRDQIDQLIDLHQQLYPTLRLYLFDARKLFSAPVTIFGPLLASVYLGSNYLVFRDTERVQAITRHFDGLIRAAEVPAHTLADHLNALRRQVR
ncbi:helix-turn-helix domain-containing protein [Flavimaricola marinus]|uniref:Helix-turn-helix protein n=1 Tax=Flavimaricola marinus TaxID=1819565 RepID=A0A238LGR7_9RHOB|nr:helix-turn-helix transcriptional regulator [Flavimaricola marinus]SMY08762.1 helix-turn-helix protein [Flavimaricola marinus]